MNDVTLPYGTWSSPISAVDTTQAGVDLDFLQFGSVPAWERASSTAEGRVAHVATPGDVRETRIGSTVHEYGGLAYGVEGERIAMVEGGTGSLLVDDGTGTHVRRAGEPALRFGQPTFAGEDVLVIVEDHSAGDAARVVVNTLGRIGLDGSLTTIAAGRDFYIDPVAGPNGEVFYVTWNLPEMPWTASELRVIPAGCTSTDAADHPRIGTAEVCTQPQVHGDHLYFMTDPEGWLNLFRVPLADLAAEPEPVAVAQADMAMPAWNFGRRNYAVTDSGVFVSVSEDGMWHLRDAATWADLAPGRQVFSVATNGTDVVGRFSSATTLDEISLVTPDGLKVLDGGGTVDGVEISVPEPITFDVPGARAHAFFYPPVGTGVTGPDGELPPLIVMAHGGPTSQAHADLNVSLQFWTSRGFAVVDVNYRGSTGWGKEYRQAMDGLWGVTDIEDCVGAVQFLADTGRINPERVAIRGGSAGGFTTLGALTFTDVFTAGCSLYGIGDLAVLAGDNHKFESRYMDGLVAPFPNPVYAERSPINHIDQLSAPMILLQGLEDRVVPPNQARAMAEAVAAKGLEVELIEFEGEGHGFRKTANRVRALEAELAFYQRVWGLGN